MRWIEKNMTEVLRNYGDLGSDFSVASNQEIMHVPMCSCSNTCSTKHARYKFTIINTLTGKVEPNQREHTITFCTKC